MSNPQPDKLKKKPTRAKPMQPDLLGSGNSTVPATDPADEAAADKQREQTETAHENTREGYA